MNSRMLAVLAVAVVSVALLSFAAALTVSESDLLDGLVSVTPSGSVPAGGSAGAGQDSGAASPPQVLPPAAPAPVSGPDVVVFSPVSLPDELESGNSVAFYLKTLNKNIVGAVSASAVLDVVSVK